MPKLIKNATDHRIRTRHHKKTIFKDEKLGDIHSGAVADKSSEISEMIFTKRCVSVGSASNKNKLIKFDPYRMKVLHEVISMNVPQIIRLCNWMLKEEHDGLIYPQLFSIRNEAYFQLCDYLILKT
jgi:hypothetical protein